MSSVSLPLAGAVSAGPSSSCATPAPKPGTPTTPARFEYEPTFQLDRGADDTPYRLLTREFVTTLDVAGRSMLHVAPEGLRLLARQAFSDIQFFFRPNH